MKEISKEEALKEMRFLFNGYKDMTSCSNPSKANIKLMQAVEMAIIALEEARPEGEWIEVPVERDILFSNGIRYTCSNCGHWNSYGEPEYCMRCGAKMRKPKEEDTQHDFKRSDKES